MTWEGAIIVMKYNRPVSASVIRRLPRYYRFLGELLAKGVTRISSKELSRLMKVTASQIRQDLNCFGGFGQQGYGYNVEALHREIGDILGINNATPAILIGAGNLGKTIAPQVTTKKRGFHLIGVFDIKPGLVGTPLGELTVRHTDELESFCQEHHPQAAIICVPKEAAAQLADRLVNLGIVGFWNFSSFDFSCHYEGISTVNVHLGDSIMTLSYLVSHMGSQEKQPSTLR